MSMPSKSKSNEELKLNGGPVGGAERAQYSYVRGRSYSILKLSVDPSYEPKLLTKFGPINSGIDDIEGVHKVLVLATGGTIGMKANKDGHYEPLGHNAFTPELRKLPIFHDNSYSSELPEELLVLMRTSGVNSPPIVYCIYEYDPQLDSCNMTMDDWKMLAKDIERNYSKFDGFVILHGTDTMAYTASALAFMLENLSKPVILTGAQIPIFEPRSDGRDNFLGALIVAGDYPIPEVCLYFNDTLLRGCRSTKMDNESFAAFSSPNARPLAEFGIDIKVHWNDVFKPDSREKFCISTNISPHVGVLRLFPSISAQTIHYFLQQPMLGVVIESYGAGNGPSARKDIFRELQEASERGVILVNITQCTRGAVKLSYETGAALADAGVIAGSDLTAEAALTKLAYVIGKDVTLEEKKEMMVRNLRGELRSTRKKTLPLSSHSLVKNVAETMASSSEQERALIRDVLYPSMMCAAAQEGNIRSLQDIIDTGGCMSSQPDYDGRSPLHVAAKAGKTETVEFLLQNGALVHLRDRYDDTPLTYAVRAAHLDVVRLLVRAGAQLTMSKVKCGAALYRAALDDKIDQLRCYHLAGVDFDAVNREGRSVVHAAAGVGNLELTDWLLGLDLDLSICDNQGQTAVDVAEGTGHADVAARIREAMSENSEITSDPTSEMYSDPTSETISPSPVNRNEGEAV